MSTNSTQKYLLAAGAAIVVAGAALYFLSQDLEQVKYDPKIHSEDELKKLVQDIFHQSAMLLCQKLNMYRQIPKDEIKSDTLSMLKKKFEYDIDQIEKEILKEKNYTEDLLAEWLNKFKDNKDIQKYVQDIQKYKNQVFLESNEDHPNGQVGQSNKPHIEHIKCENIPDKLDENMFIFLYRKQHAIMRHEIYNLLIKYPNSQKDPHQSKIVKEGFEQIMKSKPKYQSEAMRLYGIVKNKGDQRDDETILAEVFVDFYSKSLFLQGDENNKDVIVFSKRVQIEKDEHNNILKQLIESDVFAHQRQGKFKTVPVTEGGNGLSDITLDPRQTLEKDLPLKQKQLLGINSELIEKEKTLKIDKDGMIILDEDNSKYIKKDKKNDEDSFQTESEEELIEEIKKEQVNQLADKESKEPEQEKKEEKEAEKIIPEIQKAQEYYHDEGECDSELEDLSPEERKQALFKRLQTKKINDTDFKAETEIKKHKQVEFHQYESDEQKEK